VIGSMAPAAFINPAVIHRTAALSAAKRGVPFEPFRYREGVALSGHPATLPARYAAAGAICGSQLLVRMIARSSPTVRERAANTLRSVLPSSGFGPDADRLEPWRWRFHVEARTAGSHELTVDVEAGGHPGYLATARMLGEAGLMLADDGTTPDGAGCLTPAIALGTGGLDRFERAGMRFSIA
jgi:short subunit dehydrogenase-like uncharacterized protein